jgi:hypothetical protein
MQAAPPADLSHAAQCLVRMSRVSLGDLSLDEDKKDEDYVDQGDFRHKSKLVAIVLHAQGRFCRHQSCLL